jgi:polyisoprenoid-binding protein YceI
MSSSILNSLLHSLRAPRRLSVIVLSTALFGLAQPCIADARYEIDPEHLTIGFLVKHIGYANTLGFFRKASGSYNFDEPTRTVRDIRVVVDTNSVFTAHDKRDDHLRGSDFLDVKRAGQMIFSASTAKWTGEKTFIVDGELELLGKRQPLRLTGTLNKIATYPFGTPKRYVMGVSLRGTVKRSEWGMNYGVANGLVGDEVDLIIEFEAARVP